MKTLELKNNDLYLDGKRLEALVEFNITFDASDGSCWLDAKGIMLQGDTPIPDGFGDLAYYIIDEEVRLQRGTDQRIRYRI